MSHKFHSGCFLRDRAWHGLGTVIKDPVPTKEMFRLAQANYTVGREKIQLASTGEVIEGYEAMVREDDGTVLSIQAESYHIIPNDRLIELADAMREDIELNAVCVLDEGRKTTFSGQILSLSKDLKGDEIHMHLSGVNSFDGSTAFTILMSPIRVVCDNTCGWAIQHADQRKDRIIRITHRSNAGEMIRQIPHVLDVANAKFTASIEEIEAMVNKPCDTELFKRMLEITFADELKRPINDVRGDKSTQRPRRLTDVVGYDAICNNFAGDLIGDTPAVQGNVWRAFNSITQFYRHQVFSGGKNGVERRFGSYQFGANQRRIQAARQAALAMTRT